MPLRGRACVYAVAALAHLAREGPAGYVAAADMAEAEGIPRRYVRGTLKRLVDAGLLRSVKGHGGGLLRRRVPVVAFVNNHFAGYAPETVRQLATLLSPVASA